MHVTTAQKLKIKEGDTLRTLHAPSDFVASLDGLPADVTLSSNVKTFQQFHWFVKDKAQLEEELHMVLNLLKENCTLWIYYPKGTSKMQTDLTRDKGWESLRSQSSLQWLSLVSFDDIWSAFAVRLKNEKDQQKMAASKERPVSPYINAAKKEVYPPEDFQVALNKAKTEKLFFENLSFTNKKEYVEWIVSAKREETRTTRVKESIERLAKGWKNPSNR